MKKFKPEDGVKLALTGGKTTGYTVRNQITYTIPSTTDKILSVIGAYFRVASTLQDSHDYTNNPTIHNSWSSYSKSTKNKGNLLKYKP